MVIASCDECGTDIIYKAAACPRCGALLNGAISAPPHRIESPPELVKTAKSRGIYIILGLFFGLLGLHNFYARRFGVAVSQLLVMLIFGWVIVGIVVTAIWVLIELFVITKDGEARDFA